MALIVQKFGGTSVADLDRIRHVTGRIAGAHRLGHRVVVVVSAMAGETNRLLGLARTAARLPDERESDALVATGEQVTAALTALALQDAGVPARSFLGHQVRIETDSAYGRARIVRVDVERLTAALELTAPQRDKMFPVLVRSAPGYDPVMWVGGTRLAAEPSRGTAEI